MCGIAVIVTAKGQPVDAVALERMTASIVHRGPDDSGHYYDGPVGLGFRRLAILDLMPSGHQPMVSDDGRFVIVFNGEIYNYVELRQELAQAGYRFRSTGDTEVLLAAVRHWGKDCLPRLNGMWAFVVYDRQEKRLFGSRDRFGVKPMFVSRQGHHTLIASEIKAIVASGLHRGGVNWRVASRFLVEGHLDDGLDSFYEGISSVPPGAAFEIDASGNWTQWQYWDLRTLTPPSVDDPPRVFAELFEDAARMRMRSDVPVGVCLSGGLDSTSIICAAARHRAENPSGSAQAMQAFCYMAKEFDETRYIRDTLAQTGAELRQLETSPQALWQSLERMLWFQDEPVHTMTAVVGYQLMGLVAKHGIRVVLNGQGADETIGGYFSFFADRWRELLYAGRFGHARAEMQAYADIHGGSVAGYAKETALSAIAGLLQGIPPYRAWSDQRYRRGLLGRTWFSKDLLQAVPYDERPRAANTLNGTLKASVLQAPLPLYLRIEDRNSMAHSVEARLPFMDYRLVTMLFGLSAEWKIRGPWNKYVLREGMRGRIPESVRARADKMGFPTAGRQWFAGELYEPAADILHSKSTAERGIYDVRAIVRDLERHRRGETDVHHDLFHVLEFELLAARMQGQGVSSATGAETTHPSASGAHIKAASLL
ncbi:MAG: asparagine synthase (glutamine-hydrolyzing) [Nitrospiraceae bacterium]